VEKRKVTLRVMGKEYSLVTDQPEEQLSRIAGYVDRRMRELSIVTRAGESMIPILTCMTLAEELMNAQSENKRLIRELAVIRERIHEKKDNA